MSSSKENYQQVCRFVALLAGSLDPIVCWQVFNDRGGPGAASRHGRLSDPDFREWLLDKQRAGCGVYVTVNETDGKGRRRANVLHARAAFLDLDGEPLPKRWPVKPDMIVETSPGRFQVFWLVESDSDLNAWSDLQARLAGYFGGDPTVIDPPRVCRVPGFYHQKTDTPFLARLVDVNPAADFDRKTIQDLAGAHPCDYRAPAVRDDHGRSDEPIGGFDKPGAVARARRYLKTAPASIEGQRGDDNAYKVAAYLNDLGVSPEKSFDLMTAKGGWNERCIPPWDDEALKTKIGNAAKYKSGSAGQASAANDFPDDAPDAGAFESPVEFESPGEFESGESDGSVKSEQRSAEWKKFVSYMPEGYYIEILSGKKWISAAKVNVACGGAGATKLIDRKQPVHELTWAPGEPRFIKCKMATEGQGWYDDPARNMFNLYKAPTHRKKANASDAAVKPWRDHIRLLYSEADATHIERWLASRVQHPDVKINHALVLGGPTRIGKDTLLVPIEYAIGQWNFKEISAGQIIADKTNNGYLQHVILRVAEIRFRGKDAAAFYEMLKPWLTAPPSVFSVRDLHIKHHPVANVVGIVFTLNYKTTGMYLPEDDARHYVAWSDRKREDWRSTTDYEQYFAGLHDWFEHGGSANVAAWLKAYDLSDFNPKAPPPKTDAWHEIINAHSDIDRTELGDVLDTMKRPDAVTLEEIEAAAVSTNNWRCSDPRAFAHQMESEEYMALRNSDSKKGLWRVAGRRTMIYVRSALIPAERQRAAKTLRGKLQRQAVVKRQQEAVADFK